ncbi:MAG: hypothetical protein JXB85_11660 [Anaerolineales bacterium]|nr:hypothetical protein [Anaerolineales bacterium]
MRDWYLGPGDPLSLTLAADFRLCEPDYTNDHIWELVPGGGDPPALALRTTYGLRARLMRLFPRFTLGGKSISDPSGFAVPVHVTRFYPNFLTLAFSPFEGIAVAAEYWIPDSQVVAGRFNVTNRNSAPVSLLLELCGQLVPQDGKSLAPASMQSVNVLAGCSADLAPVVFITGGPQPGPGPYPSLILDLALAAGGDRTLTWVQAARPTAEESFDLARRTAARPWEAERVRLEMVNTAQTVEVRTGDPDWDAALALSQKVASSLIFGSGEQLPYPSFVLARSPDHGYSLRGDGKDYPYLWSGQSPLHACYLESLLPGQPERAVGLLRNFLAPQKEDGFIDCRPGLAGQRGRWLAAPMLVSLAWKVYQRTGDRQFIKEVFPSLQAFCRLWLTEAHDRDGDGFCEWAHPLQTGFEDHPAFTIWHGWGQGADISLAESPALAAMLYRELRLLSHIAGEIGYTVERQTLEMMAATQRLLVEECWNADAALYHYRDRDTHASLPGKQIAKGRGEGAIVVDQLFSQPVRVLVQLRFNGEVTRRPTLVIKGREGRRAANENLERMDFQWGPGIAAATSRRVYTALNQVEIQGLEKRDQVLVRTVNYACEDHTLFLPLWAGIPNIRRVQALVNRTLFDAGRFGRPFGVPACTTAAIPGLGAGNGDGSEDICLGVHLPWNQLIAEGLLAYGLRSEAAQLTARLMAAVIENLKKQRAFYQVYHSESGAGLGERNALPGLAPLGLFLQVLGVEFLSATQVRLSGKNPFPWPVTVKYRGMHVTRQAEQTTIVFPDGQLLTLDDPTDGVVTMD